MKKRRTFTVVLHDMKGFDVYRNASLGLSEGNASNRKQFYVSASRARDALHIYNETALLGQILQSGNRMSAMELVKMVEPA